MANPEIENYVKSPLTWQQKADIIHRVVVKNWSAYSDEDRRFLALAMCGEAGELANLIKKDWRGDISTHNCGVWREHVEGELVDVRIYLELLARSYGVDLDEACERKIPELLRRWPEAVPAIEAGGR